MPTPRRSCAFAIVSVALMILSSASAFASTGANARPATRSERSAVVALFGREDGNSSLVRSVFVSRSNSSLAVACVKTPEAGTFAYIYIRSGGRWHGSTSGKPGHAGNSADRQLERACG